MVTKKLFLLLVMAFAVSVISCTNDSDELITNGTVLSKQIAEDANTVITDKGEVIHLEDTTVYTVKLSDFTPTVNSDSDVWNTIQTRAANDSYPKKITVKGFDSKEQFEGYKKMIFTDAEKYGLHKGSIYLVCLYKIYKDLAQSNNESIKPRNYNTNPDDVAMGWTPDEYDKNGKLIKGFTNTTNSVNGFVTASTILRYVKCDISGASYDRFIPYTPQNLVWQYVLNYSESWD